MLIEFSYADLISGDSIPVDKVGHIKSPRLKDLMPTKGIGLWSYNFYLNILSWDKEDVLKFMQGFRVNISKLQAKENLLVYDIFTLIDSFRKLLQDAMAFFMDENLIWNEATYSFDAYSKEDDKTVVGCINRDNFEDVRNMMLQVNYIGVGEKSKPAICKTAKSKELWERVQSSLKKTKKEKDKRMEIGNIISKLCSVNSGYTLLNIYDLTIFQLYDQFFQYGYMRAMNLNERAFTIHGGKNFQFETWLEPILKF